MRRLLWVPAAITLAIIALLVLAVAGAGMILAKVLDA